MDWEHGMKIVDFTNDEDIIHQVCDLLVEPSEHAWSNLNEASDEVERTLSHVNGILSLRL